MWKHLPPCECRASGPTITYHSLLCRRERCGLGFGKRSPGHCSLFQEWGTVLLRKCSLALTETREQLFCFKPQKLVQQGQHQLCQELVLSNSILLLAIQWVTTLKFRSCIICFTYYAVIGNESDCSGGPELPVVLKLLHALHTAICPGSHLERPGAEKGGWEESNNYQSPIRYQTYVLSQQMFVQHVLLSGVVWTAGVNSTKRIVPAFKKLSFLAKKEMEQVIPRGTTWTLHMKQKSLSIPMKKWWAPFCKWATGGSERLEKLVRSVVRIWIPDI